VAGPIVAEQAAVVEYLQISDSMSAPLSTSHGASDNQ